MSDTQTIKSFLVELGFKTDESSLKKFREGVENTTKMVLGFAAALEATAATVAIGITRMANNLDNLYFASKRTGTSASHLKAFEYAAKQFGVSAEEAQSSVESLARYLRNNPGGETFLGVQTRDAKGQLRELDDIMVDLGKRWSTMPTYLSGQYAKMFGIGENMMLGMRNGDFEHQLGVGRSIYGPDTDRAAAAAREFENRLDVLSAKFDAIKAKVSLGVFKGLQPELDKLSAWTDQHSDEITKFVTDFAKGVEAAGKIIIPIVGAIGQGWKNIYDWTKAAGEWIVDHLPDSWVNKIGAAAESVGNSLGLVNGYAPNADAVAQAAPSKRSGSVVQWFDNLLNSVISPRSRALSFFQSHGMTAEEAAGVVANLERESRLNPAAVGDHGHAYGIGQWQEPRQADFKRWSGMDIRDSTFYQQLEFMAFELSKGKYAFAGNFLHGHPLNARQTGEYLSRYYFSPAAADAEARARGDAAATISQAIEINMHGTGDAQANAQAITARLHQVNADLVRDFRAQSR